MIHSHQFGEALGLTESPRQAEDVVAGSELVFPRAAAGADEMEAWEQVVQCGYEGYVGKDEASAYQGGPTRRWLKVKVPGWTVTDDRWRRRISAPSREEGR